MGHGSIIGAVQTIATAASFAPAMLHATRRDDHARGVDFAKAKGHS
jgi:hypothetical protein